MRLICPNCDAEYEVDDAAIPRDGRDVQCSACGHAWFQLHPEVEAGKEAEEALYAAPPDARAPQPVAAEPEPAETVEDEAEDEIGLAAPPPAPEPPARAAEPAPSAAPSPEPTLSAAGRGLDETVLAVLKEEAERESAARRAESLGRPSLESQTEMPLAAPADSGTALAAPSSMAEAVKRIARLRGVSSDEEAPAAPPAAPAEEAARPNRPRRSEFPAIEEINQTLRTTGDRAEDGGDAVADSLSASRGKGGFRRGLVLSVAICALIIVLYTFAPLIAARVPALEGPARAYVALVDAVRVALDAGVQGLTHWLLSLTGGQG